ncbi:MAG TPA: hypothetical protein VD791_09920 [Burkholderiales bacterium]|nr:hypothetical protein [Burkholderiales bacterium]
MAIAATIFALIHLILVAVPVVTSGGSGEAQAFAAAIFDFPIAWLLGLFAAGRGVLYGSSNTLYILIFSIGGTVMYAAVGALLGYAIHRIIRAFRAA